MKRQNIGEVVGPEETYIPLTQGVFETCHNSRTAGLAAGECNHKNNVEKKHSTRPLIQVLFETPDPSQETPNDSNGRLYRERSQQFSSGSSEDLENLDTECSEGANGFGLIWYCLDPKPEAQQDAEREGMLIL
ncbi:unnamed protein product [Natator depressus]